MAAAAQQDGGGHVGDRGRAAPQPAVIQSAKAAKLEGKILAECERVRHLYGAEVVSDGGSRDRDCWQAELWQARSVGV